MPVVRMIVLSFLRMIVKHFGSESSADHHLTFQEEQFGKEDGEYASGEGDRLSECWHRGSQAGSQRQGKDEKKGNLEQR